MKDSIFDMTSVDAKYIIDVKKDEAIGVIKTWISREIYFEKSGIDYPHAIWNKLKTVFNKVNAIQVMYIEKELISLEHLSFD